MRLKLPKSWKDITLREMQVLLSDKSDLEKLSAVTGESVEDLREAPRELIAAALEHLNGIPETKRHLKTFELQGKKYGFIPDWEEFTAGEYIDMESYLSDFWENAARVMSLLYREIDFHGKKGYTIKPYTAKEDYEPFYELPADIVSGALLFFWTIRTESIQSMQSDLLAAAARVQSYIPSGAGTQRSTRSREKIIYGWRRLRGSLSKTS